MARGRCSLELRRRRPARRAAAPPERLLERATVERGLDIGAVELAGGLGSDHLADRGRKFRPGRGGERSQCRSLDLPVERERAP
jgi:hypothetical protein